MPKVRNVEPKMERISVVVSPELHARFTKFPIDWSEICRKAIENQVKYLEDQQTDLERQSNVVEGWVTIRRPGEGVYRLNGVDYKIVIHKLVGTTHRVAFLDRKEVARAVKFTTLIKRLKAL